MFFPLISLVIQDIICNLAYGKIDAIGNKYKFLYIKKMSKVYHPQVAEVLQSAFKELRHTKRMTVKEMCDDGAAMSLSMFYRVKKGRLLNTVPYSRIVNFYARHLPEPKANDLMIRFVKAWIAEDLGKDSKV